MSSEHRAITKERADSDSDDLLAVQETLRGNREAFVRIVRKYTPLLYSLAYRLLASREEAEEAVQEILFKAYRSLGRFRLGRRFYPWLYTVAVNHLRSQLRKRFRRQAVQQVTYRDDLASPRRPDATPEQMIEREEGERLAAAAVARLPLKYREVFVLRQIEGLSVQEVGEILGIPEGTVKTHLHRARHQLIGLLADKGWETP